MFDINVGPHEFKMEFMGVRSKAVIARLNGVWEPWTTGLFYRYVKPGMKVLDLGSCYGYHTILLSKMVGPEGRVVSAEASPILYELAQKNLAINGVQNVSLFNVFLSNRKEPLCLEQGERIINKGIERREGIRPMPGLSVVVPSLRPAVFIEKHYPKGFDFAFMDIEGFEMEVLADMADSGCACPQTMVIEQHYKLYEKHLGKKYEITDLAKAIEQLGFKAILMRKHFLCVKDWVEPPRDKKAKSVDRRYP